MLYLHTYKPRQQKHSNERTMLDQFDPKETTEMLLEWLSEHYTLGFSDHISPLTLTKMAVFDMGALESSGYRTGNFEYSDFDNLLQSATADAERAEKVKRLLVLIKRNDEVAALLSKPILKILDDEYKQYSFPLVDKWEHKTFIQKVNCCNW